MSDTQSFEELLMQFDHAHPTNRQGEPKVGQRVRGTLVSIGEDYAFVDLGGKAEGRMEIAALRDAEGEIKVSVGDSVEVAVTGTDPDSGTLLLGSQHGHKYHGLEEVQQAYSQGLPVQGQVTGAVKGGLEVQVAGLRAFCPASQADIRFVEDLSEFVGQRFDFRITKLEGGRRPNLVVSRRALLEEEQRLRADATRAQLKEGAVFSGVVTRLQDYGAFVDIGGLEGMVHVSELAFARVKHPSEIVQVGQQVEVAVLRIEPAKGGRQPEKIALSIRALKRDPWSDVDQRFPVGMRVAGIVSRLQPFGAFVELEPGLDGLVHVSELGAGRHLNHPSEVLKVGDRVEASVLGVDRERRRISLTLDETKGAQGPIEGESPGVADRPSPPQDEALGSFGVLLKESLDKRR